MSDTFFEKEENVRQYLEMTSEYDGTWFYEQFQKHIPTSGKILELGMGPGKDLDNIRQKYNVIGSDYSFVFAELYKRQHPEIKVMVLDAVTIKTKLHFDCIYSNKVMHHLTTSDFKQSLARQAEILNSKGLVLHTFWRGSGKDEFQGLLFQYYEQDELQQLFGEQFNIIHIASYQELKPDDSIIVVAQKST
ncbi:class I SAM-dependent methyltransferase [Carboxylicivirga sediminis]|uniref:Class I SAM-dependent methyltransferase n=1 Tax=Carboxylicivirga sediminis TaxID=2006564 RepID=A0A941F0A1_9BACT|nr:class I SAM-dependent methyltransferase [Carboxylicivirga sediminis]MBR8534603.1 class I SAM-dependent methyltransferase [Carboxylicivirga sediminis]